MNQIEMYKETLKAVNNEYQRVLTQLEEELFNAYEIGEIPLRGVDLKDTERIMLSVLMTAKRLLKLHCDDLLEQIESEMEK